MFKIITASLILISVNVNLAQNHIGIHQLHKKLYKIEDSQNSNVEFSTDDIIPFSENPVKGVSTTVFGYMPDWEYLKNSQQYFRWELLTHIGCFDFFVSPNGDITNPAGWPWSDVINSAHSSGTKVIMVVTNFDKDDIRKIITDSLSRSNFLSNVKLKMDAYKLDGINVDFEGLYSSDRGNPIVNFVAELTDSVHSWFPGKEVSFAAPAVNWSGHWNLRALADACDYLFIMGYDFFGSFSTNSGPSSPLTGGSINITNTVLTQYSSVTNSTPEKLILGLPYFGLHFKTESSAVNSKIKDFVNSPRYSSVKPLSDNYGRKWSDKYQTPWFNWNDGVWNQIWYDDDESIALKYDIADSQNLKGIGMWALGYDGERQELWNLLDLRYGSGVIPAPDIPQAFHISADTDSTLRLHYDVPQRATSFEIEMGYDGKNFPNSIEVNGNDIIVESLSSDSIYYFRVKAINSTGKSNTTEVLVGIPQDSLQALTLIVNGFDRVSGTDNTFNFVKEYSIPLTENDYTFVSSSNEAVFRGKVGLNNFKNVFWILGDESTADETFNQFEQDSIKSFLNNGGNFFVSGSEIGWDLGRISYSSPNDIYFYNNYLKANYLNDAPGGEKGTYYKAEAISGGIFAGVSSFSFDDGSHGTFDVDWPDAIYTKNGSSADLKFVNVQTAKGLAGISFAGKFPSGNTDAKVVHLSIPFETIYPESKRIELMGKVIEFFETDTFVNNEFNNQPDDFILYQNYPNPFNPSTKISFSTNDYGTAKLEIFSVIGELIDSKNFRNVSPGVQEYEFNSKYLGKTLSSGFYIYRISFVNSNGEISMYSKKMMLLK